MEWQDISTAPKDGTWILAIVCGNWMDGKPYIPSVSRWTCGSWDAENYDETGEDWFPTHWMPLPDPPTI